MLKRFAAAKVVDLPTTVLKQPLRALYGWRASIASVAGTPLQLRIPESLGALLRFNTLAMQLEHSRCSNIAATVLIMGAYWRRSSWMIGELDFR